MNGEDRIAALEQRVDRFETRVERELANGARNFARREVVDRMESDLRSDIGDLKADVAKARAEIAAMREDQLNQFKAIKNGVVLAITSAIVSGGVSFLVWLATKG